MIELTLIRHGMTAWSREKRILGRHDLGLDDQGARDVAAWRVPEALLGHAWVTSPLARARETARLLIGANAAVDERLIELDWGEVQGLTLDQARARFGSRFIVAERRGWDFRPPGGEGPADALPRLRDFLGALRVPTVAVTHKGVIRTVTALATGWNFLDAPPVKASFGRLHRFAVVDGRPHLIGADEPMAS